jgi:hypothetical protein
MSDPTRDSLNTPPGTSGLDDFFVAGGTLRPGTASYVTRPTDDELFHMTLAGEFCFVLTPRQMGKSSLMVRARPAPSGNKGSVQRSWTLRASAQR